MTLDDQITHQRDVIRTADTTTAAGRIAKAEASLALARLEEQSVENDRAALAAQHAERTARSEWRTQNAPAAREELQRAVNRLSKALDAAADAQRDVETIADRLERQFSEPSISGHPKFEGLVGATNLFAAARIFRETLARVPHSTLGQFRRLAR